MNVIQLDPTVYSVRVTEVFVRVNQTLSADAVIVARLELMASAQRVVYLVIAMV